MVGREGRVSPFMFCEWSVGKWKPSLIDEWPTDEVSYETATTEGTVDGRLVVEGIRDEGVALEVLVGEDARDAGATHGSLFGLVENRDDVVGTRFITRGREAEFPHEPRAKQGLVVGRRHGDEKPVDH